MISTFVSMIHTFDLLLRQFPVTSHLQNWCASSIDLLAQLSMGSRINGVSVHSIFHLNFDAAHAATWCREVLPVTRPDVGPNQRFLPIEMLRLLSFSFSFLLLVSIGALRSRTL